MNADRFFWTHVPTGSSVQWEMDRLELGDRAAGEWGIERLRTQLQWRGLLKVAA